MSSKYSEVLVILPVMGKTVISIPGYLNYYQANIDKAHRSYFPFIGELNLCIPTVLHACESACMAAHIAFLHENYTQIFIYAGLNVLSFMVILLVLISYAFLLQV